MPNLKLCFVVLVSLGFIPTVQADPVLPYAPGEVLVSFKKSAVEAKRRALVERVRGRPFRKARRGSATDQGSEVAIEHLAVAVPVSEALEVLQNDPTVAFVEPNYLLTTAESSNDPIYEDGRLWGVYGNDNPVCGPSNTTNQFGTDAEEAWSLGYTGSENVYVGIIDEGVQVTHPDLADNIWKNSFDPIDGRDNDNNGYVDDSNGWDFHNEDASVFDPADGDDHGTHVSGTIGARGGNRLGGSGVAWNVRMISAKFIGSSGGYVSDAISALNYLRDLKTRHGLRIIASSNSWGGGGYSSALHTAILRAAKAGILFVAAAGNNGSNNDSVPNYPSNYTTLQGTSVESPASYEAVIAVAAISPSGERGSFSNYGRSTVDIGAPGVGIWSTVPTDSYASYTGTSMAAPHVTGVIALYAAAFPAASPAQIRAAVLSAAKPTDSLAGVTVTGGRLSLEGLFQRRPSLQRDYDVAVQGIAVPTTVSVGQKVTILIRVANEGNQTVTALVSLAATGGSVGSSRTVSLAPRSAQNVQLAWTAPSTTGAYSLTGRVSHTGNRENAKDLADNSLTASVTVP